MPPVTHTHTHLISSAYIFAVMLIAGTCPGPSVPIHTSSHLPVISVCMGRDAWARLETYVQQLKSLCSHTCAEFTHTFQGLGAISCASKNFAVDGLSQKCHFAAAGLE